jgi:hypothetical protein
MGHYLLQSFFALHETVVSVLQYEQVFADGINKFIKVFRVFPTKCSIARMRREVSMLMQFFTPLIQAFVNFPRLMQLCKSPRQHQLFRFFTNVKMPRNRFQCATAHDYARCMIPAEEASTRLVKGNLYRFRNT